MKFRPNGSFVFYYILVCFMCVRVSVSPPVSQGHPWISGASAFLRTVFTCIYMARQNDIIGILDCFQKIHTPYTHPLLRSGSR